MVGNVNGRSGRAIGYRAAAIAAIIGALSRQPSQRSNGASSTFRIIIGAASSTRGLAWETEQRASGRTSRWRRRGEGTQSEKKLNKAPGLGDAVLYRVHAACWWHQMCHGDGTAAVPVPHVPKNPARKARTMRPRLISCAHRGGAFPPEWEMARKRCRCEKGEIKNYFGGKK